MDGISPWPSRSSQSRGSQVLERLDWLRSRLPPPSPSSATWAEVTSLSPSLSNCRRGWREGGLQTIKRVHQEDYISSSDRAPTLDS